VRLASRTAPHTPDEFNQRRQPVKREPGMPEPVKSGKQMDDMFTSFKKSPELSQKEKERIDNL